MALTIISAELFVLDYDYASSTVATTKRLLRWSAEDDPMYTLSEDCFIYTYDNTIYAWNIDQDRFFCWSIPDDVYIEIFVDESSNLLVLISHLRVYCYKVKDFTSSLASQHPESKTPLVPAFIFDIPGDMPREGGDLRRQSFFYRQAHYPRFFEIRTRPDVAGDRDIFWSYEICIRNDKGDEGHVRFIARHSLPVRNAMFDMDIYGYRLSCGRLFKMFYEGLEIPSSIHLAFQDVEGGGTADHPHTEVELLFPVPISWPDDLDEDSTIGFDPVSGRLCYFTDDFSKIVVVDYLPPIA
ncbi:hypothetical protein CVT24_001541 [Panaeolus cyanescens]|uniref:Uncharacterized protein n=1 Tax=Panaeolus cyanescens TaxID=181874 RepID=A0A409YF94_9AGAR|nr:hypothetical protein CVT24_001541 [Panaeolus cyanescens]